VQEGACGDGLADCIAHGLQQLQEGSSTFSGWPVRFYELVHFFEKLWLKVLFDDLL
jgi:hypothetical protein